MNTNILEGKSKHIWTAVFMASVILITLLCFGLLNHNYDALARYPYKDENSKELIKEHLNQEEIDYIIQYSIPPNMFIAYIEEPGFSIYHAAEYKKLSQIEWQESTGNIVKMVEESREFLDIDTLCSYLRDGNYQYADVIQYFKEGDFYSGDSALVYPVDETAYLDDYLTISTRKAQVVKLDNDLIRQEGKTIEVREEVAASLNKMCSDIKNDLNSENACAALVVTEGYVSYESQKQKYDDAVNTYGADAAKYVSYPGHSEHQLGLAVDLTVDGLEHEMLYKTPQYEWIEDHAYQYGFIQTYTKSLEDFTGKKEEKWHLRYIGIDLAKYLHDENLNFAEYSLSVN